MTAVGDRDKYDEQVIAKFRAQGGVVRGALADTPMLLLHHVGVRSRLERVTPLVWWPAGETAAAVLASDFGAPRHPGWFYNLVANPATTAEIGTDTWKVHARVAAANERRLLLERIMTTTPSAAAAVRKTKREIPVVVLDLIGRLDNSLEETGAYSRSETRSRNVKRALDMTGPTRSCESRGGARSRLAALGRRDRSKHSVERP
jgi:deazaflavin-dependent oxidoreductase (nitroreductase family)